MKKWGQGVKFKGGQNGGKTWKGKGKKRKCAMNENHTGGFREACTKKSKPNREYQ